MLRFASLGSGSGGNAWLVEASEGGSRTRLLLDCGFSARQCEYRLARLGVEAGSVSALVITHEHSDHVAGASVFARRHRIPVFSSLGTARAARLLDLPGFSTLHAGQRCAVQGIELEALAVSHDAAEPLQFVFGDGDRRLAVLTDLGTSCERLERRLDGLHALVLETNHDEAMLRNGPYPAFLKARVGGDRGHLSNRQAAALLAAIDRSSLGLVVAAHLSETNNSHDAVAALLSGLGVPWRIAQQQSGCDWCPV